MYDAQTRESHPSVDLSQWHHGLVILLDPLRIKPPGNEAQCIAAIRPSKDGAILMANNEPIVNALGRDDDMEAENFLSSQGQLLQDGMQLLIGGRLELEYRNPRSNLPGLGDLGGLEGTRA